MSDSVQLLLSGHILPGFAAPEVAASLARLFKIEPDKALGMLAGRSTVIRKTLPQADAARYLKTLADIGAEARVEPLAAAQPAPPADATPAPALSLIEKAAEVATHTTPPAEDSISCPACQLVQPKRTLCRGCGADMPRMLAAAREAAAAPAPAPAKQWDSSPRQHNLVNTEELAEEPAPAFLQLGVHGRLNRLRYMAYNVLALLPIAVIGVLIAVVGGISRSKPLILLVCLAFLPALWLFVRIIGLRLHDLGRSAHWIWLLPATALMALTGSPRAAMVVIIVIGIASIALCLLPGARRANEYGAPNPPNSGLIIAGAVVYVLLNLASILADKPGQAHEGKGKPVSTRLQGPIEIERAHDPAEQEALVRAAIDAAAEAQGVTLDEVGREAAVQAYLRQIEAQD